MTDASRTLPNVVIVVMDCARADIFRAEVDSGARTPFLQEFRQQCLVFPGAVSPGSWTIPSHASLFTGLYPWDHGAHCKVGTTLPGEPDTLASVLGRAGYATGCFSANGYVQPASGLTRGFDHVVWGGDKEFFLRFLSLATPTSPDLGGPGAAAFGRLPDNSHPSPIWNLTIATLSKYTALWDGLNRTGARLLGHPASDLPLVAPWIEPHLSRWLSALPDGRPAFAFVNLLENHEPYLVDGGQPVSIRQWLSYVGDVQGEYSWVQGRWVPTAEDVARSRDRYARTFQAIDERVRRLVDALRKAGRWENTLFVLTSDHGQAFLEHDTFYHRFRVDEEVTRIPLWVRPPGRPGGGGVIDRWVSLIDIPKTVTELIGSGPIGDPSGLSLLAPSGEGADRPVYSMTDGLLPKEQTELPPERRALLDRLEVATYLGTWKGIADPTGATRVFRVSRADPTVPARPAGGEAGSEQIREAAKAAIDLAASRIASQPAHASVKRRLAGWGY